jgi:hypothetical protein
MAIRGREHDTDEADETGRRVGRLCEADAGSFAARNTVDGTVSGGVVQAHTITGGVHHHHHPQYGRSVPWHPPITVAEVCSVHVRIERSGGGGIPVQPEWRWCDKCQGLFYGPRTADSRCRAGDTHRPPEQSRSGTYYLLLLPA